MGNQKTGQDNVNDSKGTGELKGEKLAKRFKPFEPQDITLQQFEQSRPIAEWIGNQLTVLRSNNAWTFEIIAMKVGCEIKDLEKLEAGKFHFKSGRLQHLISGYGTTLLNLLEESTRACANIWRSQGVTFPKNRPFQRTDYYSFRRVPGNRLPSTPMFVAGDPSSFLWALPMRRMKEGATSIEFLELAQRRNTEEARGTTEQYSHPGSETVYVIRGSVHQHVDTEASGEFLNRPLSNGDVAHFNSSKPHYVENISESSTAFLLIVRMA